MLAHHSFAAEYESKEITLTGMITKVEWTNPHIYFYIDVKDASGNVVNWAVEGYPPNTLKRTGFTRDDLKIGDKVTVTALPGQRQLQPRGGPRSHVPGRRQEVRRTRRRQRTSRAQPIGCAIADCHDYPLSAVSRHRRPRRPALAFAQNRKPIPRARQRQARSFGRLAERRRQPVRRTRAFHRKFAPPVNPPPKREPIPYQAWAETKIQNFYRRRRSDAEVPAARRSAHHFACRCRLRSSKTPKEIVIAYESFHAFRIIPINDKLQHPNDLVPTWMGDSVARWDGDTLVVDVTGFNDKTWLSGTGSFHSEDLHVVERFTLNSDDTITYTATVTDPKVLTKPWVTGALLRRPPNTRVEEYECIENNQDAAHMARMVRIATALAQEALVFLENAAVDHHRQSRGFGFARRSLIHHAFLHPDRGRSDANGRFHHRRHQLRSAEDIHDVDVLGNVFQPRVGTFRPAPRIRWDSRE